MVGVAQLVEHLVVVQDAAGSSPVTHPNLYNTRVLRAESGRTPRVQVPSLTPIKSPTKRLDFFNKHSFIDRLSLVPVNTS